MATGGRDFLRAADDCDQSYGIRILAKPDMRHDNVDWPIGLQIVCVAIEDGFDRKLVQRTPRRARPEEIVASPIDEQV